MNKRKLGKTGMEISPVAFAGIVNMDETVEDAIRYTAYAVGAGVNYFDVAPSYGNAEERLGPALKPFRKEVYLACKTEARDAEGSRQSLLDSLKRLETDYFDVFQLHAMSTKEDVEKAFGKDGVIETVKWAKKEGLIRNIGFSTHNEDVALQCLEKFDFDTVLFPMNWAMGLTTGWGDRISEKIKERGIGLLAMKTMIIRNWRDGEKRDFPKSWCKPIWDNDRLALAAMKYGFYKGAATLVPPGNFTHQKYMIEHVQECLDYPISDEELGFLRDEAEKVRNETIF